MQVTLTKEDALRLIEALTVIQAANEKSKILKHSPLTQKYNELRCRLINEMIASEAK